MDNSDIVQIAYKKLKSHLFFDKTLLPLRNALVQYEENLEEKLNELSRALFYGENWNTYEKKIINDIGAFVYPKELNEISDDTVIFNADNLPIEMKKPQFFIDLSVEGHILSVIWLLTFGVLLDGNSDEKNPNGMYEHSYGNRLKKTLLNQETNRPTWTPNLFEPYFTQYESWRDYGLKKAKERLDDNQDAIILTLDFKGFYYSVDIPKEKFVEFTEKLYTDFFDDFSGDGKWMARLNQFVYNVLKSYSDVLRSVSKDENLIADRTVLPIGFLPSNILSNLALTSFDDAIIDKWNPVYYGRYVDDIIIVDKVEKNSPLYKKAREANPIDIISSDYVIDTFLNGILEKTEIKVEKSTNPENIDGETVYQIVPEKSYSPKSKICIQNKKVKMFYFHSGSTLALLDSFRTQIAQNASEFKVLPNLDSVLEYKNYSEIFNLKNEESINKFRGITGIELDKFALSKFLGKYRKVSGIIRSEKENEFEKDLMIILDERTLISNYISWERLFEILIINKRYSLFEKLAIRILGAISKYKIPEEKCNTPNRAKETLGVFLISAICRTSAVVWNDTINAALVDIINKINHTLPNIKCNEEIIKRCRKDYCNTRMVNKYLLPLPIDCVLKSIKTNDINLSSFEDVFKKMNGTFLSDIERQPYYYYPYLITPQEISFVASCWDLKKFKKSNKQWQLQKNINNAFLSINYPMISDYDARPFELSNVKSDILPIASSAKEGEPQLTYSAVICNEAQIKNTLNVAIGNVKLSMSDFYAALDNAPNRSYERYKKCAQIFDDAIRLKGKNKVDILVLPENYLPFEWVPTIARLCANNKIALVTGIEHIVVPTENSKGPKGIVYNLTAVILPYESNGYPFASVTFHNKVHYAPHEIEEIRGRRYDYINGDTYCLFGWKNIWFPVYCCYELAAINDRSLFREYADMVVAVEWNKDVSYYSNIIESLSRDLHCYCVQVNSSDYGDSRIIAPKETIYKDIIKTKGGKNSCILVDELDIKGLRDFQVLEYSLQQGNKTYKPTPPGMNKDGIIEMKRKNKLYQYIDESGFNK